MESCKKEEEGIIQTGDGEETPFHASGTEGLDTEINFLQIDTVETNKRTHNIDVEFVSSRSLYKNLIIISLSFLLLFTAFQSLQSLQSSLNVAEGLGTIGLTTIYCTLIVSSIFLPGVCFSKFGMKWTMVVSMVTYLGYIAASFHAVWVTIIPSSILIGVGAANLWSGQMAYVTELAKSYSRVGNIRGNIATDKYFGIFFAIFHTADIWGNLASSLVLSKREKENVTETNSTCGVSFCPLRESGNPNLVVADRTEIYTYSGFCLGCGAVAALLMAVLLDNINSSSEKNLSSVKLLTMGIRHFKESGYQQLLIPASIYRGFAAGFMISDFNAAFTSCTMGVEHVGYIMMCYGLSCSVSALVFGRLTRWTGYMVPFIISFTLHSVIGIVLFLWTPNKVAPHIFYICVAIWAVGYSVYSTLLSSLYGNTFPKNTDAAISCFRVLDSTGWALSFGLSSFLCTNVKLALVLTLLVISTVSVLTLLVHKKKTIKRDT